MKAGLRLILFLGCDPEAATEFAFLSQIWQRLRTVSKATCHFSFFFNFIIIIIIIILVTFLSFSGFWLGLEYCTFSS